MFFLRNQTAPQWPIFRLAICRSSSSRCFTLTAASCSRIDILGEEIDEFDRGDFGKVDGVHSLASELNFLANDNCDDNCAVGE